MLFPNEEVCLMMKRLKDMIGDEDRDTVDKSTTEETLDG